MAVVYSNKEVLARIVALDEAGRAIEALKIASRALAYYASEENWGHDDWGCKAVICAPDYGEGGKKARSALKRMAKALPVAENEEEQK